MQYLRSGGEATDSLQAFRQRYNLALNRRLNHAISLDSALSYNRTQGDQLTTTEDLIPSMTVGVSNNIFRAALSATATERWSANGQDLSTRFWDATWASAWQRRLWPAIRLSYGQSSSTDRETPPRIDTSESNRGIDVDWDLLLARVFYRFNQRQGEDHVTSSDNETASHFARLETGRTFWQDRLNVNLSQQFTRTSSDLSAVIPRGGVFERPLEGINVLADIDATPGEGQLPLRSDLNNRNRNEVAVLLQLNERWNIAVEVQNQRVDFLHLYVDPDPFRAPPMDLDLGNLRWTIFTSTDNITWTQVGTVEAGTTIFNQAQNRLEVPVGNRQVAVYLKVVLAPGFSGRIPVTEVEAIQHLAGDGLVTQKDRYTNYLTTVNLGMRLTQTLAASSSVAVENGYYLAGNDFSRRSASGSLRWTPSRYVLPTLGVSQTSYEAVGSPNTMNRSYSLFVAILPLPTLDLNLGATRSESFTDSTKTAITDRFSILSTARLYPDLTAGLDTSFSTTDNLQQGTSSDLFDTRLTLTARLTPRLTADLQNNLQTSTGATSVSDYDTSVSLNYRPSDLLSMRVITTKQWGDSEESDLFGFNLNLGLLSTPKTRMTFIYTFSDSTTTSSVYSLLWDWDISRIMALRNSANYTSSTSDHWNIMSQLWLRF